MELLLIIPAFIIAAVFGSVVLQVLFSLALWGICAVVGGSVIMILWLAIFG